MRGKYAKNIKFLSVTLFATKRSPRGEAPPPSLPELLGLIDATSNDGRCPGVCAFTAVTNTNASTPRRSAKSFIVPSVPYEEAYPALARRSSKRGSSRRMGGLLRLITAGRIKLLVPRG